MRQSVCWAWLLGVVCQIGSFQLCAHTDNTIIWLTEHAPSQQLQVLDINDGTFSLLQQQLHTLQVTRLQATVPQAVKLLQSRANVCVGNKLPLPARRDWGVISTLPQVIFPGLRLYVLKSSGLVPWLNMLNDSPPLSMQRLMTTNQRFKLGFAAGRSYGDKLDRLLQDESHQRNVVSRAGPDNAGGLLQMFSRGRIDLLIEYPNVVAHYLSQLPQQPEVLSYALAESPAILPGHIICSDTPQGRFLLRSLDQAISTLSKQRPYLDAHLRWFSPELHTELTRLYNEVYGTNF
ncbi:MAG: hypothetical protein U5L02_08930 [Rheinheimera sp.]|nr:hypothetical protein [Rheinheimera sp.]